MAKSKKQKAHALRKELIKASLEREQEWKPETIKEDLAAFSDRYLKKAGKSNPRATHLTNIFRGLNGLIASQFGRTAPKTRLALQEYKDRYVFCSGVAIMVKTFGKRKKLLVSKPTIVATFPDRPHTNAYDFVQLPVQREIDSHIWLDLDDVSRINDRTLDTILFGEMIAFAGKSTLYRGFVSNNVRSRAGKYGLSDIIMYGAFAATADGECYKASTFYRLSNKRTVGIMEYSEKEQRYVPIKTDAHSLPEKFATSKELEEIFNNEGPETIFMNIFYLQMYTDIPEFRKKVDEYNKKYLEDRIFFNE